VQRISQQANKHWQQEDKEQLEGQTNDGELGEYEGEGGGGGSVWLQGMVHIMTVGFFMTLAWLHLTACRRRCFQLM